MQKARLIFKENTPYSLDFEDFYFNSSDGINESKFIYSEAFEFSEAENFVIAESGFGIGLNFFLILQRFQNTKIRPKRLFYTSIENFYIEKEFLREAYKRLGIYDEFKENLELFLKFYPCAADGIYRFYFKDCFLDLVFGDISVLKRLEFRVDVWFLDGFAPSKNRAMFDENFTQQLARLCKNGALICSFSASSFLRKNLQNSGFLVQKVKGFKKREMIKAKFLAQNAFPGPIEPFFARSLKPLKNKKIALIGAGICSAVLAFELALRGFDVEIFEKASNLGAGASGNESGILSSLILKKDVILGEFSAFAFIEASRFYKQILDLNFNGVQEIAHNDLMLKRFESSANPYFEIKNEKAFSPFGGAFNPKNLVQNLFEKSLTKINFNHEFTSFEHKNDEFILSFKNGQKHAEFSALILSMGADTRDFANFEKFSKVRGQITHLSPFLNNKIALSAKGYICPANDEFQVIGATYDRLNLSEIPKESDDLQNLENILDFLPKNLKNEDKSAQIQKLKEKIISSRASFRSYSSDRFAVIGQHFDEDFYKQNYKSLHWKRPPISPPKSMNLFYNFAHGSRGFSSAILAARYLCSLINDEPLGFYADFIKQIHPARFLIRKLKKGL